MDGGSSESFCHFSLEMNGQVYVSCVRSSMPCESETMTLLQVIRWMCGISVKDRSTREELRSLVGVEPITTVLRSGRLRWYGHVTRKSDENWMKKCMEYRVKGRRPVRRPSMPWLESVEADVAELEID